MKNIHVKYKRLYELVCSEEKPNNLLSWTVLYKKNALQEFGLQDSRLWWNDYWNYILSQWMACQFNAIKLSEERTSIYINKTKFVAFNKYSNYMQLYN